MTQQRRPTLADVARLSGMSKTAVSMILNDRPGSRLSEEAAGRVRDAAAQLGYKPNPAAQSLRLGKTRTIGFISDQVTITRYASGMIRGVLRSAAERDHTVLITEIGDSAVALKDAFMQMIDRRVDGIILGLMGARMVDVPTPPAGLPFVIVNGQTSEDAPSVLPDEYAAGRAMASVLVDAGHRRIGIIGDLPATINDPRQSVSISARFRGIDDVLNTSGVQPVRAVVDAWSPAVGYAECRTMLARDPDVTAILVGNDSVAFGVYQALADLGLRIPDDISVVSFDDEELAAYLRPGLTTARLPYEEMARRGVQMLLGDRPLAHDWLPMPVINRESVRTLTEA